MEKAISNHTNNMNDRNHNQVHTTTNRITAESHDRIGITTHTEKRQVSHEQILRAITETLAKIPDDPME